MVCCELSFKLRFVAKVSSGLNLILITPYLFIMLDADMIVECSLLRIVDCIGPQSK